MCFNRLAEFLNHFWALINLHLVFYFCFCLYFCFCFSVLFLFLFFRLSKDRLMIRDSQVRYRGSRMPMERPGATCSGDDNSRQPDSNQKQNKQINQETNIDILNLQIVVISKIVVGTFNVKFNSKLFNLKNVFGTVGPTSLES